MAITINDREIDGKLEDMRKYLMSQFGIKTMSKTDTIRYLLDIRKQGKKTNRKWKNLFR